MTTVTFFYQNDLISGVEMKGHTGYAKAGKDIVCAAISTLAQSTLLGLIEVLKREVESKTGDGYLKYTFEPNEQTEILMKTLLIGLKDIKIGYPKHLKLEETKNVY